MIVVCLYTWAEAGRNRAMWLDLYDLPDSTTRCFPEWLSTPRQDRKRRAQSLPFRKLSNVNYDSEYCSNRSNLCSQVELVSIQVRPWFARAGIGTDAMGRRVFTGDPLQLDPQELSLSRAISDFNPLSSKVTV